MSLFCALAFTNAQNKTTYTYAVKGKDTLKLDVYKPNNIQTNQKLPTLLWIHGGGFSGGARDYKDDEKLGKVMAEKGYVMVSISYRLLRKGTDSGFSCDCPKEAKIETFKQAVIDYYDAAKYIVDNAERFHIDSEKIIAGGSSAGAETVLNAVYMREYFLEALGSYENVKFAGVWSLAGAVINANYITEDNAIPTAVFHGTDDNLVPYATAPHHYCSAEKPGYIWLDGSATIVAHLTELETPYYFYSVTGGKHEVASIPYDERLDEVLTFFDQTAFGNQVIQTKKIIQK